MAGYNVKFDDSQAVELGITANILENHEYILKNISKDMETVNITQINLKYQLDQQIKKFPNLMARLRAEGDALIQIMYEYNKAENNVQNGFQNNSGVNSALASLVNFWSSIITTWTSGVAKWVKDIFQPKQHDKQQPTESNKDIANNMESVVFDQIKTGDLKGNEKNVAQYLLNQGLSPLYVAAIMGNIEAESGFNPGSLEVQHKAAGDGIGLCQWSFSRRTQLEQYAADKGMNASDINIQLDFLWAEITGTGDAADYCSVQYSHSGLLKISDLEEAVYYFGRKFERPSEKYAHWDRRIESAKRIYSSLTSNNE